MKKTLFTMMAASLMVAANAQETKPAAAADAAEDVVKAKDVSALLKDQLIKIDGEKVEKAKLAEGMEYYLVYHSASW